MPSRPFSECSVTFTPGRDVIGDQRGNADAEIHAVAVAQFLRGAPGHHVAHGIFLA